MFKIFKKMTKYEWYMAICSLVFIVIQVWLDLKMPDYMSAITILVETPGSELSEILLNGSYMLLCAVGSMAAAFVTGFFTARIAAGLSKSLRAGVFKKVMRFNSEEMGHFSTSSLITRTTNDITQIQTLVAMGLQAIIKAPILLVWAVLKISGKQWQWSAATGGAVLIILVVLLITIILALPKFTVIQKLTDNLNRVTRENLTGIRVVRAYNAEGFQEKKFEAANEELTGANLFANRVMALLMPTMTFVTSGISLVIYWIGAYLIDAAGMTERLSLFSDMVVFSSYALQVIMAFTMLTLMFIMLPRVMVSIRRVNEVLDTEIHMEDGTVRGSDSAMQGEVVFRNVSFRYPGAGDDMLKNISFTAHRGETVAFIGSTGSGKSTLVNLIPCFYDATEGQILVDGIDVREYEQKALRNKLGYVSQRAVLFSGSVESNVSYGDNGRAKSGTSAVAGAVSMAQDSEFVEKMDGGLSARIAQGGTNVSGGQKQRLSIARAICREPEIYIFNDSFSALDYKTDRILRTELNRKLAGATKLIVAQRIGTIRNADKIIVLEDGKIAGMGTHAELMKDCAAYQEIAYIRLFTQPLSQIAQVFTSLQSTMAASERVFEFLDEEELEDESEKIHYLQSVQGDVEFKGVRFGYDSSKTIIHDFSANIKAGQTIAIVGPTGAGKTTIVNLLMHFYDTDKGEILIDGVPIRELRRENVRDQFCMVLQDTWLFEGTLRENIVYSKERITDAQLDAVCRAVGLEHFVKSLTNGYDTILNEQTSISAGQRQLVTIARAMIENAPLLILDEATSSVDTKTELVVQNAMHKLTEGRTSFVIAHRLSTIKNADLILVLKDGDIIESGNHGQLIAQNGFYAELYNSQFEQAS